MKDQGRVKTYLGEGTKDLRGQEGQNRGLEEHGGCVKGGDGEKKVVLGGDNLASARKWGSNGGGDTKQG